MPPRKLVARKLLVASIGVATINYVAPLACGGEKSTSSTFSDAGKDGEQTPPTSGNLAANPPPPPVSPPTSANLPAPPPPLDSGLDADAEAG